MCTIFKTCKKSMDAKLQIHNMPRCKGSSQESGTPVGEDFFSDPYREQEKIFALENMNWHSKQINITMTSETRGEGRQEVTHTSLATSMSTSDPVSGAVGLSGYSWYSRVLGLSMLLGACPAYISPSLQ